MTCRLQLHCPVVSWQSMRVRIEPIGWHPQSARGKTINVTNHCHNCQFFLGQVSTHTKFVKWVFRSTHERFRKTCDQMTMNATSRIKLLTLTSIGIISLKVVESLATAVTSWSSCRWLTRASSSDEVSRGVSVTITFAFEFRSGRITLASCQNSSWQYYKKNSCCNKWWSILHAARNQPSFCANLI